VRANPWLAVGTTLAALLILAWIGWAIHVAVDHGAREGLGALLAWAAIAAALALISVPFIWAFRVIRASVTSSNEPEAEGDQPEPADDSDGSDSAAAKVTETG
jgi:hypothetical protein